VVVTKTKNFVACSIYSFVTSTGSDIETNWFRNGSLWSEVVLNSSALYGCWFGAMLINSDSVRRWKVEGGRREEKKWPTGKRVVTNEHEKKSEIQKTERNGKNERILIKMVTSSINYLRG